MAEYTLAGVDGEVQTTQPFVAKPTTLPREQAMPLKPKDCAAWLMEKPCDRWPFVLYWLTAIFGLVMLILIMVSVESGQDATPQFILMSVVSIMIFSFAAYSFRIALKLREQVNREANLNANLKKQNTELRADVDKLTQASLVLDDTQSRLSNGNKRLAENVKKFGELQQNLGHFAGGNIEGMEALRGQVEKMNDSWRVQLIKNEKNLLFKVYEQMEDQDGEDNMTETEYNGFLDMLPNEYSLLFQNLNRSWQTLAGEDGLLQIHEFIEIVDEIVERRVDEKWYE